MIRIRLTGSLSGNVTECSVEEAIETLNDCPEDERLPVDALRNAFARGESVDTYFFCAQPIECEDCGEFACTCEAQS